MPASRATPAAVDGDLFLLDPAVLETLRGETARIDGFYEPSGMGRMIDVKNQRSHHERFEEQQRLRHTIGVWATWAMLPEPSGLGLKNDREAYKAFYHFYSLDVESAKALDQRKAEALRMKITEQLNRNGVLA